MLRNFVTKLRLPTRKVVADRKGNVLLLTALGLPMLIGFVGLGTDTIQWTLWKRQIQRSADSAAISGVYQRIQDADATGVESAVNRDLLVNRNDVGAFVAGYPKVTMPADESIYKKKVKVELAVQKRLSFSGMFMSSPPIISSSATASVVPGRDFCIVSLEKTSKTGILGDGNSALDLTCGMITNSTSLNAAIAKGSATMKTEAIAAVGGIQQSDNWLGSEYLPFSVAIEDPFSSISAAIPVGTPTRGAFSNSPNDTTNLQPGIYTKFDAKGTVNLAPGTYYISNTNFEMGAQAKVSGTGVTIVMTNTSTASNAHIGNLQMSGGSSLKITAPLSGPYKGLALYQDRRAIDHQAAGEGLSGSSPNQIIGNSETSITGFIYIPSQQITVTGSGTMTAECMLMVVKRVVFSGNGSTMNLRKNCASTGAAPVTAQQVRLIS